jgi:hypothetical protein
MTITRHADHDPALICRPAFGNGLCEPLSAELSAQITEALKAVGRGETEDLGDFSQYADDEPGRITEAEYIAALPGRAQKIAGQLSECLPEGMRFEWGPLEPQANPDAEDVDARPGTHRRAGARRW